MTVDLSEFLALGKPPRPPCAIGVHDKQLSKEDREKLQAALEADQGVIGNQAIALWLKGHGCNVPWQLVRAHRSGVCNCVDG
jgi:hypothetical protein